MRLVLTNIGIGGFGMHPVHLHGHDFAVLKIGYPPVFADTGAFFFNISEHADGGRRGRVG